MKFYFKTAVFKYNSSHFYRLKFISVEKIYRFFILLQFGILLKNDS